MEIDLKDLLSSVPALRSPGVRIGFPDDPTPVDIVDLPQLSSCLDSAFRAFCSSRGVADYLVDADVNSFNRTAGVAFIQPGPRQNRSGPLAPEFLALNAAVVRNGGVLNYWGDGQKFFGVTFPFRGPIRDEFPNVDHLPWDDRYRHLLDWAAWTSLRRMVYRFSHFAKSFAARCVEFQLSRILVPSVGLCVHPWLFADHGASVVATDAAASALAALSKPHSRPRLYSRAAFDRWDLAMSAAFATQGNPEHFDQMPDLENLEVRSSLRRLITFALSDWAALPLEGGSIDAIFATNALPRESSTEQARVLKEWTRVVRPGGLVFIVQHNFYNSEVERILQGAGWVEANILGGKRPVQPCVTGFQVCFTSG